MGLLSILEKIGSIFTRKKLAPDEDGLKITRTVEDILTNGTLVLSGGFPVGINLQRSDPTENEKLEKLESAFSISPEKRQLYETILAMDKANNEQFFRTVFLDVSDYEWAEKSVKQAIGLWPSVISNFINISQLKPKEQNPAAFMKIWEITKEEAAFLSKKQTLYKRWKGALVNGAKNKLGGKK